MEGTLGFAMVMLFSSSWLIHFSDGKCLTYQEDSDGDGAIDNSSTATYDAGENPLTFARDANGDGNDETNWLWECLPSSDVDGSLPALKVPLQGCQTLNRKGLLRAKKRQRKFAAWGVNV
jgi:hypothetical protein